MCCVVLCVYNGFRVSPSVYLLSYRSIHLYEGMNGNSSHIHLSPLYRAVWVNGVQFFPGSALRRAQDTQRSAG